MSHCHRVSLSDGVKAMGKVFYNYSTDSYCTVVQSVHKSAFKTTVSLKLDKVVFQEECFPGKGTSGAEILNENSTRSTSRTGGTTTAQ